MAHVVNELDAIVTQALDALIRSSSGALARLDGFPDTKVVVRIDWTKDRVALVSGGGAGHEPAHAGFVGRGLLTAAVCGEIFASPTVDAVLSAISAVTGPSGCLVIVKNYTGDRLAFGLAVERARANGLLVEMVVMGDDVAIPGAAQPRGLAGTLFVHKAAGALAEGGASLPEVVAVARQVAVGVRTVGVALTSVAIPGRPAEQRILEGHAELGLGIHGEPGVELVPVSGSRDLIARMTHMLRPAGDGGSRLALLLNNLGGLANLELAVALGDLLATEVGRRTELVVGPAALMTSLSMQGFSLSALPLDDDLVELLEAEVADHTAWPGVRRVRPLEIQTLPAISLPAADPSADDAVRALVERICLALVSMERRLNELDAQVGDGDTGTTLATACQRLLDSLDALPFADIGALMTAISGQLATTMGGSSGVLASLFFAAGGTAAAEGASTAEALYEGAVCVQRYGGAAPGDRTMLDALLPALEVLRSGGTVRDAAAAAETGAAATAELVTAKAGRSTYVPSAHLIGVADPGAVAVAAIFGAAAEHDG